MAEIEMACIKAKAGDPSLSIVLERLPHVVPDLNGVSAHEVKIKSGRGQGGQSGHLVFIDVPQKQLSLCRDILDNMGLLDSSPDVGHLGLEGSPIEDVDGLINLARSDGSFQLNTEVFEP